MEPIIAAGLLAGVDPGHWTAASPAWEHCHLHTGDNVVRDAHRREERRRKHAK